MRVALVIYGSLDAVTGGYIYDHNLVKFLRSQEIEVKVFSQQHKSFWRLLYNNFSKKLLHDVVDFSPDMVLQDGMNFASLFLFNKKLKRRITCPVVCLVHLLQSSIESRRLRRFLIKKLEKEYLQTVDAFIFNSAATKKSVAKVIGNNILSIIAFPGKDRLRYHRKTCNSTNTTANNKLLIIFVGNIVYNKGLHVLLSALSQIDTKLWGLSVVGALHYDHSYSNRILKMITYLRLNNNINMLGVLQPECLTKKMLAHHLLAVPSYYESFGIVYAEAMGAGLPVIATKLGGASEIVQDNINGFLVAPGDSLRIRNIICTLINDRSLLMKMSVSSLQSYQKMPTWNESMQQIYDFLLTLLDKK